MINKVIYFILLLTMVVVLYVFVICRVFLICLIPFSFVFILYEILNAPLLENYDDDVTSSFINEKEKTNDEKYKVNLTYTKMNESSNDEDEIYYDNTLNR